MENNKKVKLMLQVSLNLILISLFTLNIYAQGPPQLVQQYSFTTTEAKASVDVKSRGLGYYKIIYNNNASTAPSACTIVLQTSPDNNTWSTGISKTCTTDGQSVITALVTSYVRLNLSTYTPAAASSTLNVTIEAYNEVTAGLLSGVAPSVDIGASDSGTARSVEASTTLKRYISVGVTEDESQVKATAGVLISVSAWNVNATAYAFLKCTNATAANTTPGSTAIFYSMVIPPVSGGLGFIDSNINAAFSTALTCYLVLSKEDTAVDEVAANEVGYNLRYR